MTKRRTLYIGLGGTGKRVVSQIYFNRFKDDPEVDLEHTRFLAFDFDKTNLHEDGVDQFDGVPFVQLFSQRATGQRFSNLHAYNNRDAYEDWFYDIDNRHDYINKRIINAGAGQWRPFGRLAYFMHREQIEKSIKKAIDDLNAIDSGLGQPLEVIVVGSIAGGTGSALIIDLGFYLAGLKDDADISLNAFLLLPSTFDDIEHQEKIRPNGYATLKELNAFYHLSQDFNVKYPHSSADASGISTVQFKKGTYEFFDRLFLFDKKLSNRTLKREDMYSKMAEILELRSTTSALIKIAEGTANAEFRGSFSTLGAVNLNIPSFQALSQDWFVLILNSILINPEVIDELAYDAEDFVSYAGSLPKTSLTVPLEGKSSVITGQKLVHDYLDELDELVDLEPGIRNRRFAELKLAIEHAAYVKPPEGSIRENHLGVKSAQLANRLRVNKPSSGLKMIEDFKEYLQSGVGMTQEEEYRGHVKLLDTAARHVAKAKDLLNWLQGYLRRQSGGGFRLFNNENKDLKTTSFKETYKRQIQKIKELVPGPYRTDGLNPENLGKSRRYIENVKVLQAEKRRKSELYEATKDFLEMIRKKRNGRLERFEELQKRLNDVYGSLIGKGIRLESDGTNYSEFLEKTDVLGEIEKSVIQKVKSEVFKIPVDFNIVKFMPHEYRLFTDTLKGSEKAKGLYNEYLLEIKNKLRGIEVKVFTKRTDTPTKYNICWRAPDSLFEYFKIAKPHLPSEKREAEFDRTITESVNQVFGNSRPQRFKDPLANQDEFQVYFELHDQPANDIDSIVELHQAYLSFPKPKELLHVHKDYRYFPDLVQFAGVSVAAYCGNDGCDFDISRIPRTVIFCPNCENPILNRCGNSDEYCDSDNLLELIGGKEKISEKIKKCPSCNQKIRTFWGRCDNDDHKPFWRSSIHSTCSSPDHGPVHPLDRQYYGYFCLGCKAQEIEERFKIGDPDHYHFVPAIKEPHIRELIYEDMYGENSCPTCESKVYPECPYESDKVHFIDKDQHRCDRHELHNGEIKIIARCHSCYYPLPIDENGNGPEECPRCLSKLDKCDSCSSISNTDQEPPQPVFFVTPIIEGENKKCPNCLIQIAEG